MPLALTSSLSDPRWLLPRNLETQALAGCPGSTAGLAGCHQQTISLETSHFDKGLTWSVQILQGRLILNEGLTPCTALLFIKTFLKKEKKGLG